MKPRTVGRCIGTLTLAVGLAWAVESAHARSLEDIKESGEIEIVTTSSSPPHGFLDPDSGELVGVMYQIGRAIAASIEVEPNFTEVPFAGLIPSLTSGRADLMSGPLFITEKRAQAVDFSDPVYGWGEGLLVREDNDQRYNDLSALSDNTVGTLVDSVQYEMVQEVDGVENVRTYKDYVSLLQDLRNARIDVAIVDPPSVAYQIKVHDIAGLRRVTEYEAVNDWKIGLAVEKGNTALREEVNAALADMRSSGRLEEILAEWDISHLLANP